MSSKKEKNEISVDMDNFEQALKQLAKCDGVNSEMINLLKAAAQKELKSEKHICPAAVRITTKSRVNKAILEDKEVYEIVINKKTYYFARCSKPYTDGEKYCHKHAKTEEENPDNLFIFEKIKKKPDAKHLTSNDLLEIKKSGTEKVADDNPNPVIIITVTQTLKNTIAKMFKVEKDSSDKDDEEEEEDTKEEEEDTKEEEEDKKEEEEDKKEEKDTKEEEEETEINEEKENEENEEEEIDAEEIKTKDGRELCYSISNNKIYEQDKDDHKELGELLEVNDNEAPILYGGKNCIVSSEHPIEKNNIEYTVCALSDKVYKKMDDGYVKVGKIKRLKNGKIDIELDKKNKK